MRLFTMFSIGAIAVAGLLAPNVALAAGNIDCFNGDFPAVDVATITTARSTKSKVLSDLPGARLNLPSQACARVQFTAQVKANVSGLRIRVLVDGIPMAPNFVDFHTVGSGFDSRSATFVVNGLTVDTHTFSVQFASTNGRAVVVDKGTVTVWSIPIN